MMHAKSHTVYMLSCSDSSFYVGVTSDLPQRLFQHNSGAYRQCYTYRRRPVLLVYTAVFTDVHEAISWEKTIKRWSRNKKQALITSNQTKLEVCSKRKTNYTRCSKLRLFIRKKIIHLSKRGIVRDGRRFMIINTAL